MRERLNLMKKLNFIDLTSKTSIKHKLILSYILICVSMIAIYVVSFVSFKQSLSKYDQIIENLIVANQIPTKVDSYLSTLKQLILSPDEVKTENFNISDINKDIEFIEQNTNYENTKSRFQIIGMKNLLNNVHQKVVLAVSLRKQNKLNEANEVYYTLIRMSTYARECTDEYLALELNFSTESRKKIQEQSNKLGILSFILIILVSTGGLYFGINYARNTTKALFKLANTDLSKELLISNYKEEEIEYLYNRFMQMQTNIESYCDQISYSEKRIASIMNEMSDCVITTNSKGVIESCNQAIYKTFNYLPEEIIGQNINILIPNAICGINSLKTDEVQSFCVPQKVIDGKFQLNGVKKNQETFPLGLGVSETIFEDQIVLIFVVHDMTQHAELDKLKDEFISVVNHELRTPLTSIQGSLSLILNGVVGETSKEIHKLIEIASNNSIRLVSLINDILDMEKIIAKDIEFKLEPTDIEQVISQAIEANKPFAAQYNVTLEMGHSFSTQSNVDKNRLNQVVTNLLSNAAKFSDPNETVTINMYDNKNIVRITISDKGPGIPEEFQDKIFNKFVQVDSSSVRKKGGTGLGLSICKGIIEKMGGSIGFTTQVGEGTTFYFDLPKLVSQSSLSPNTSSEEQI